MSPVRVSTQKIRQFILATGEPLDDVLVVETVELFDQSGNPVELPIMIGAVTFRTSHGFLIEGVIDTSIVVPDFMFSKTTNQTSILKAMIARIESGTSVDVSVRSNASVLGTAKTVTSTKQSFSINQALSDGDALDLVLSNLVGVPTNLGATLVIEHIVTS